MFVNPNLFIAIALTLALFFAGRSLVSRIKGSRGRMIALLLGFALCLPGLSFVLCYIHLFEMPLWYIQLRSFKLVEVLSAGWGFLGGLLSASLPVTKQHRRLLAGSLVAALLLAWVPFVKPMLLPIGLLPELRDTWQDEVCLQSVPGTCGPCSLATVLRSHGVVLSEEQVARNVYTCIRGSESWYLARYARELGFRVVFREQTQPSRIAAPAVVGVVVKQSGLGHFIALLGKENGRYFVGDPWLGRRSMTDEEFHAFYGFSGFVMSIKPENGGWEVSDR